jgi:hypothetical protein
MGYLNHMKGYKYRIRLRVVFRLELYVGASFALLMDSKLHTGCIVLVAGAPVFCTSVNRSA